MSWLARSIANTLHLGDDDADAVIHDQHEYDYGVIRKPHQQHLNDVARYRASNVLHPAESLDLEEVYLDDLHRHNNDHNAHPIRDKDRSFEDIGNQGDKNDQGRRVKDDLSEFGETITRQLWGVASFLAPPPPPPPPPPQPLPSPRSFSWLESDQRRMEFAERSDSGDEEMEEQLGQLPGLPRSFLEVGMPEEEEADLLADAVGITDESLDFAENTAHHPETWLNFPLPEEEEFDGTYLLNSFEVLYTGNVECSYLKKSHMAGLLLTFWCQVTVFLSFELNFVIC